MAKRKGKKKKKEEKLLLWQYLVRILAKKNYTRDQLCEIAVKEKYAPTLTAAGPVVSMAIGIARDNDNPIVYSWDRKLYTMRPTPAELKKWFQSRLRFMDTVTSRSKGALAMAKGLSSAALDKQFDPMERADFRRFSGALSDMGTHFEDVTKKKKLAGTPATSRWRLRKERSVAKGE
jgi:hypothetical protein